MKLDARSLGRGLVALAAALFAAAGASTAAQAAHDDGVVRAVGAGFTGVFRALDLLVASPMLLLPVGTRALRAGLASALVAGIAAAIAFDLARALVAAVVPHVLALRWRRYKLESGPVAPRN